MRLFRAFLAAAAALPLAGCGYVHFGRLPENARAMGDSRLAEAYSNLSTEHKILKQELALARREGDALRVALERAGGSPGATASADLVARLNETASELATLRASHAQLQAERANRGAMANDSGASGEQLRALEEKLSASQRDYTQLQAENTRLRGELDRTQSENAALAERLKTAAARYDRAQADLTLLNSELLAHKQARTQAEQANDALRAQLGTVIAQSAPNPLTSLQLAKAPPAEASPTAELRTNMERVRQQAAPPPASPSRDPEPPAPKPGRKHVVQTGDTLEKLSQRYYGAPDRWQTIYEANTALLGTGQPLRPGMELTIPE